MEPNLAINAMSPQSLLSPDLNMARPGTSPEAVGQAFEGMFASILLKQMRQSLEEGLFASDSGDVLGGLFDQFLGEHVAKSGGLGVGAMIRMQLERNNQGALSS